ncbi:unnamed protein product [Trichogramma brassicae]|uniref:Uncharacterized protein n=1 Tax=Trichogramma brassicae TaxID=86971 RepID=A0A6H5HZL4_9HYME|nr:unnamed protein product [Trichogramma brassicae]
MQLLNAKNSGTPKLLLQSPGCVKCAAVIYTGRSYKDKGYDVRCCKLRRQPPCSYRDVASQRSSRRCIFQEVPQPRAQTVTAKTTQLPAASKFHTITQLTQKQKAASPGSEQRPHNSKQNTLQTRHTPQTTGPTHTPHSTGTNEQTRRRAQTRMRTRHTPGRRPRQAEHGTQARPAATAGGTSDPASARGAQRNTAGRTKRRDSKAQTNSITTRDSESIGLIPVFGVRGVHIAPSVRYSRTTYSRLKSSCYCTLVRVGSDQIKIRASQVSKKRARAPSQAPTTEITSPTSRDHYRRQAEVTLAQPNPHRYRRPTSTHSPPQRNAPPKDKHQNFFKAMNSRSQIKFMECLQLMTVEKAQQHQQQQRLQQVVERIRRSMRRLIRLLSFYPRLLLLLSTAPLSRDPPISTLLFHSTYVPILPATGIFCVRNTHLRTHHGVGGAKLEAKTFGCRVAGLRELKFFEKFE